MAKKFKRQCEDCVARMPDEGREEVIRPGRYRSRSNRWQCTPCYVEWLERGDPVTLVPDDDDAPSPRRPTPHEDDW